MKQMQQSALALAALAFASLAAQADTGSTSGSLNTTFAVGASCHVSSNGGSTFSDYGSPTFATTTNSIQAVPSNTTPLNQQAGGGTPTASSIYAVQCGNGISYTVAFSGGSYYGALGTASRSLFNSTAGQYIAYELFDDITNTVLPSDGTAGFSGVGSAGIGYFYVSSRVTDARASQEVAPGGYGDTVQVAVSYGP